MSADRSHRSDAASREDVWGAVEDDRECGWCRVPYHFWRAIRCIETDDDLVFCSAICLERWEDAHSRAAEIVSELPFSWGRGLVSNV